MALASFLRPTDSPRATSFAIGNATTCSISGFMTTAAHSGTFYTCMLSYYFLFTARFGLKNSVVARRIEPVMHCISLGYPIISAIVGAYYEAYADTATYFGCFVNCPPGTNKEDCIATTLGWIFYGWPFLFVLASLIVNNLLIWRLVHGHSVTLRKMHTSRQVGGSSDESSAVHSLDDDISSLGLTKRVDATVHGSDITSSSYKANVVYHRKVTHVATASHLRRLQLVKSQALLFVASYAFVSMWGGIMAIAEQYAHTEDEELSLLVKMYPIMVLHALLAPMQGLFNMLVYVRPKYLTTRHEFGDQSRWWAMKRAMLGEKRVRASGKPNAPTALPQAMKQVPDAESPKDGVIDNRIDSVDVQTQSLPLKRGGVSSLTANSGSEFHDEQSYEENLNDEEQDRWGGKHHDTWTPIKQAPRHCSSLLEERDSSLGMISELTETQFEPIIDYSVETRFEQDHRFETQQGDSTPAPPRPAAVLSPSTTDSRWTNDSAKERQLISSLDWMMPQRLSSTTEMHCTEDPMGGPSTDVPLQTPMRIESLELISEIEDEGTDDVSQPLPPSALAGPLGVQASSTADRTLRPPVRRTSPTLSVRPKRL
ncbi:unnamed protein product [Cylindrotheca closterium]|uniref:Uncharacterized protein n=1 Tax=Cylindrotheca closterium TaxID=2856 RepID=A0AAD2CE35_9STRA|nr:unnamed protein product [Cylindrotheca closterium]